jgi:hypothetical protein
MLDLHSKEMEFFHALLRHAPTPQVAMGILGGIYIYYKNNIKLY